MKHVAACFVLGLLAACTAGPGPRVSADAVQPLELSLGLIAAAPTCRIGPDDGPVLADRGIGGTGAPLESLLKSEAATRVADRGIGGTGIGGTGIVGVVTGFASICVDGLDVRYDGSAAVDVDGTAASVSALRAGQVVVIQAQGTPTAPRARVISVRREVAGRIEALRPGSGILIVAGQAVAASAATRGSTGLHVGDWIAVSGLRQADGTIIASRLDRMQADRFMVHGQLIRDGGILHVGTLVLEGPATASLGTGQFVTASGHYLAGKQQLEAVAPDTLFADPAAYFGASVSRVVVQAFVRVANNVVSFNGLNVPVSPELRGQADLEGMAVVSLERRTDGTLVAVGLYYSDYRDFLNGTARTASAGGLDDLMRGMAMGGPFAAPGILLATAMAAPEAAQAKRPLPGAGKRGPMTTAFLASAAQATGWDMIGPGKPMQPHMVMP